jgi:hypothetical protein
MTDETGVLAARRRFGGLDLPAALAGMLSGVGLTMLLGAGTTAVVAMRHDNGVPRNTLWNASWIAAAAIVALSLLVGGLAATGHWADDRWNLLNGVTAPSWASAPTRFGEAAAAVIAIGVVLVAAGLGGMLGAAYHRRADAVIATGPAVVDGDADVDVARADYSGRHAVR